MGAMGSGTFAPFHIKITKRVKKHEGDYTPEEKSRIGKLEGECIGYMTRGAVC